MPIYLYHCGGCGREQEVLQSITEGEADPRPGCPFCPERMYRVPSTFWPHFKGQGWTPTHYPNRKGNK